MLHSETVPSVKPEHPRTVRLFRDLCNVYIGSASSNDNVLLARWTAMHRGLFQSGVVTDRAAQINANYSRGIQFIYRMISRPRRGGFSASFAYAISGRAPDESYINSRVSTKDLYSGSFPPLKPNLRFYTSPANMNSFLLGVRCVISEPAISTGHALAPEQDPIARHRHRHRRLFRNAVGFQRAGLRFV